MPPPAAAVPPAPVVASLLVPPDSTPMELAAAHPRADRITQAKSSASATNFETVAIDGAALPTARPICASEPLNIEVGTRPTVSCVPRGRRPPRCRPPRSSRPGCGSHASGRPGTPPRRPGPSSHWPPPPAVSSISPRSQVRYSRVPGVCGTPAIAAPGGSSIRSISRPAMRLGQELAHRHRAARAGGQARRPGRGGRCGGAARPALPAGPAAPARP